MGHLETNHLRNVDNLLDYYEKKVSRTLKQLCHRPEDLPGVLWSDYLDSDHTCKFNMGSNPRASSVCLNCKALNRLKTDPSSQDILIEYGRLVGTQLTVETFINVGDLGVQLKDRVVKITDDYPGLLTCGTPNSRLPRVALDPVTCKIVASWCYENIVEYSPRLITAFKCGKDVHIVKEKTNPINWSHDVTGILYQLVTILNKLSKYHFTHGSPSPHYIRFSTDGDNRLSLEMSPYCNMSIGTVRITSQQSQFNNGDTATHKVWNVGKVSIFSISREAFASFRQDRRSGSITYPGSFEFYCFLVGMMTNERFQNHVESYLGDVWNLMWLGVGDTDKLKHRLEWYRSHRGDKVPSYEEIMYYLLDGIWMRCDILDIVTRHIS